VRLYESTIPSGNAYKVSLLLHQLGRTHSVTELDILATPSETRTPEFLAKNPNGRIPVLELEDGTCLAESNAILCYLAAGSSYLSADRVTHAQTLQWLFFEQYSHEPYVAVLKFWTYWGGLDKLHPVLLDRARQRGQDALDVMAAHLTARDFFAGGAYSIADIALFAYTAAAENIGYRVPPPVLAWLRRVRQQPGYTPMKTDPLGKAPR
jgi:glutathione S-transferase